MEHPIVMVTGSNRNTGLGIAKVFAAAGYDVVAAARSEENAAKTVENLSKEFPDVKFYGCVFDQRYAEQVKAGFEKLKTQIDHLDALVCNATMISGRETVMELPPEQMNEMLMTNVTGYLCVSQEAAKMMIPRHKGSIVMISSIQSKGAVPRMSAYAASKAAINSLSGAFALELARDGIRCNTVIAGAIWVDRWEKFTPEELAWKRGNWPLERESTAEEIGQACLFLASDASATVTGAELNVDSGIGISLLPYNKNWK